jgi:hypothetical protein
LDNGEQSALFVQSKGRMQQARRAAIMDEGRGSLRAIHRNCGQLCAKPAGTGGRALKTLASPWLAEILGSAKAFSINDLRQHDKRMTGTMAGSALRAAVVEFRGRANPRFADG